MRTSKKDRILWKNSNEPPGWEAVPAGYNYVAQDQNGEWYFHSEPVKAVLNAMGNGVWLDPFDDVWPSGVRTKVTGDSWRETFEVRQGFEGVCEQEDQKKSGPKEYEGPDSSLLTVEPGKEIEFWKGPIDADQEVEDEVEKEYYIVFQAIEKRLIEIAKRKGTDPFGEFRCDNLIHADREIELLKTKYKGVSFRIDVREKQVKKAA